MTMKIPGRAESTALALFTGCMLLYGCTGSPDPIVGIAPSLVPTRRAAPLPTPTFVGPLEPTAVAVPGPMALTEAGCCSNAWWSPDGSRLFFFDDPPGDAPAGVYSVSPVDGTERLETEMPTGRSLALEALREPEQETARRLGVPASATQVRVSPDGSRFAWTEGSTTFSNLDRRQRAVWVTDVSPPGRRRLAVLVGGDLVGWSADGNALVTSGGLMGGVGRGIWRIPVDTGDPILLVEADRPRSARLSPGGRRLAFYLAFEDDPALNGVWIVDLEDGRVDRLDGLAAYRWQDDDRLAFIPFDAEEAVQLWRLDLSTGNRSVIAGSDRLPGGIAGNDWSISPTGSYLAYRSADDGRLWSVALDGG
jgi:dipeptidyl aminopeptidase/acylaminoacyl peptidase